MSKPLEPCQNTYPLKKPLAGNHTLYRLVLWLRMKRKNTIRSDGGAAAPTKTCSTFFYCHSTKENHNSLTAGWDNCWEKEGGMQIEFGHRSKDLSFPASSGPKHSPPASITSLLTVLHWSYRSPGVSLQRGVLAECEHCSYTSVLNRDVNTNRFWQDPGPPWTHCRSRKKTNEKEGEGAAGVG